MTLDAGDDNIMAPTQTTKQKTAGRPTKGPSGERVSDYPRLTIRLPNTTKERLDMMHAGLPGKPPVWEIVNRAVLAYFEQNERKVRAHIDRVLAGE